MGQGTSYETRVVKKHSTKRSSNTIPRSVWQELELENQKRGKLISRLQEIYDDCSYIAKKENPDR
jgi:hypothetical protein